MPAIDLDNEMFMLAASLVNESNRSIFLTGKAGTGKTTFLKYIRENCIKQVAVTAPTGVAAINAGGATIHSFFQLPLSPFIPEARGFMQNDSAVNKHSLIGRMRLTNEKRKVLRQLELLIIDEISMVRCDTLDAIDVVLRYFRNRNSEPFGGVQVLLIGDMFQLPPVVPDEEWNLLSQFYRSAYFFDSQVMQQFPPAYIEFQKIYRQSDTGFIQVLNEVRHNNLSEKGLELLNSRYDPWFELSDNDGYIFLTTHNFQSDKINNSELGKLKSKPQIFKAIVEGDFNEKAYPADELLELKTGAQVMFIKNDREKIKRYFNGKIGVITKIDDDAIYVQCDGDEEEIEVNVETWENIRYTVDKQTQQLEEDVIGKFMQYPLRLAWAVTIHKSQGLTFDKAVIDAARAFAPGQVYVALSRCTTLNGIVLKSQITPSGLQTDARIIEFSKRDKLEETLRNELIQSKKSYQENLLLALFDLTIIVKQIQELKILVKDNAAAFNQDLMQWINELETKAVEQQGVAEKFQQQLNKFFKRDELPEQDETVLQRLAAASGYFIQRADELMDTVKQSPAITDSKQHAKSYNDSLKDLFVLLAEKKQLLQSCLPEFSVEQYYRYKKSFTTPAFGVNAYATAKDDNKKDSPHPVLHKRLRELRNKICEQKNLPVFYVAGTATIDEMAEYLPQDMNEIVMIKGFGSAKAKQYGKLFIDVINEYCEEYHLSSFIHTKKDIKEKRTKSSTPKADTKQITYNLYKEGHSVAEISKIRNFAISTIESHLSHYIERGLISVNELVQSEKIILIESCIDGELSISSIKEKLGDAVSYSEIKMVVSAKKWEQSNGKGNEQA